MLFYNTTKQSHYIVSLKFEIKWGSWYLLMRNQAFSEKNYNFTEILVGYKFFR